jgi:hypothetical protein
MIHQTNQIFTGDTQFSIDHLVGDTPITPVSYWGFTGVSPVFDSFGRHCDPMIGVAYKFSLFNIRIALSPHSVK